MFNFINIKRKMKENIKTTIITILIIVFFSLPSFAENVTTTNVSKENTSSTITNTMQTTTNNTDKQNTTNDSNNNNTVSTNNTKASNKSNTTSIKNSTNTTNSKTTSTNTISNSKITTTQTTVKSSNANLSNLGITPHDFSGFKESKTEYNVTVPNTISEVQVYATKKDINATVTGTGNIKLKEGQNTAKVIVTAEDGTQKTYTINIKRLKEGETETTTISNSGLGLKKLEIQGLSLDPSFNSNTYQYTVNFQGDEEKLEIKAEANKETAGVKIIGNDNLINGQNIITILVIDSNGESVNTYQIYANKNFVNEEELNKQMSEAQMRVQIKRWIVIIVIIIIIICIIILLILVNKKANNKEYKKEKQSKEIKKGTKDNSKNKKSGRHSK